MCVKPKLTVPSKMGLSSCNLIFWTVAVLTALKTLFE